MAKKNTEEEIPAAVVAEESAAPSPTPAESKVKVRVLANGLRVAGGVAAKGKILVVKLSEAKTLEELNKVTILGV